MESRAIHTTEPKPQTQIGIDLAFAAMADDAEYQVEAAIISEEFAKADWEAFEIGESQN